jgi:hypothetical protein
VKITKSALKKLIKEELENTMDEGFMDSIKGALGMGGGDEAPAADPMANVPEEEREDYEEFRSGGSAGYFKWEDARGDNFDDTSSYEAYEDFLKWRTKYVADSEQSRMAQYDIDKAKQKRRRSGSSSSSSSYGRDRTDPTRATSAVGSSNLAYGESVEKIEDIIREVIEEMNRESK